ncbi:MAG TPA: M20/M25/M40 family metallo-hydrolase [Solirubrobacteraceae bacterium]|nr:M20/M25/M40 family metallo-hydrolase [Solirubrobacteraceae bacterium]
MTSAGTIDIVLDHHVGALRRGAGAADAAPRGFDLLPEVEELLVAAARLGVRVRLALPRRVGSATLRALGGAHPLVEETRVLDARAPPADGRRHVLVAADRVVRAAAVASDWAAVAHPALALPTLLGQRFVFARLAGDVDALHDAPGVVPCWVERAPDGAWAFALLSPAGLAKALDAGLDVDRLALRHDVEDALLVQLDEGMRAGELAAYDVLWSRGNRLVVAVGALTRTDEIPAHGAHGHFRLLTPSPELLRPAHVAAVAPRAGALALALAEPPAPAPVTAETYAADVSRYAGAAPLSDGPPVRSRHSSHPDNPRVVVALLAELREIGLAPVAHEFAFGGRILRNVIADIPGEQASLVVVGCHLDSTAARDPGFTPARDAARGADDDASGMAAVLAIGRHAAALAAPTHHTVRLCFFNAEESGLVGSRAYATSLKARGAQIAAVVCVDMIGFNSDSLRTWEVHAGFTDPAVRDLSLPLAQVVARAAEGLGALPPAQVYSGTTPTGGTDPARFDGAINRSDHASFQEQGYPAVLVSEDFFPNRPGDPAADPNPNYHSNTDTVIDAAYGADITRAVSVAVLQLAAG